MKRILQGLVFLLTLFAGPAIAQTSYPVPESAQEPGYRGDYRGVLSAEDQKEFDEQYERWQKANADNDRDDIDEHARKMQDIMARYRIPADTSFDLIASSTGATRQDDIRQYQGRFSKEDQKRFDEAYEDWVEHRRNNDRDDIAKDEGKMLEIMSRYNIPRDVPYDALSSGARGY